MMHLFGPSPLRNSITGSWLPSTTFLQKNVHHEDTINEEVCISDATYMDDCNWITESQHNLEEILHIANEFYDFNSIQVNLS